MRTLFTNRPHDRDITINFFYQNSSGAKTALLACPFFTDSEPVKILKAAGCQNVKLLVRLCEATSSEALTEVHNLGGVDIRFYTESAFHAKFYIIDSIVLFGSANLTGAELKSNRELSIAIKSEDPVFDEIPSYFDELWGPASVLTTDALERFRRWRRTNIQKKMPLIDGILPSSPETINVGTQKRDAVRTYIESFRATYVESLIPAYRIVERIYRDKGHRHPQFDGRPLAYEIDRFLFWVRGFTTDEHLEDHPLRSDRDLANNISDHIDRWFELPKESLHIDEQRVGRIKGLQNLFTDENLLSRIEADEITDLLQGCAAFVELLRFTSGGLSEHLKAFKKDNDIRDIRATLSHLAFGGGDYVQRVYDCIFVPKFKLAHWGKNCTFELFGWTNREKVPPLNGRIIKALRYLGFSVSI